MFWFLLKSVYFGSQCKVSAIPNPRDFTGELPAEEEVRFSKNLCSYFSSALARQIFERAHFADTNGVADVPKEKEAPGNKFLPGPKPLPSYLPLPYVSSVMRGIIYH